MANKDIINIMILIDLFSGAGGLTEGFLSKDYEFVSHIEMDKYASNTLETRSLYHHLLKIGDESSYFAYLKDEIDREQFFEDNNDLTQGINSSVIQKEISTKTEKSLIKRIKNIMENSDVKKVDGIIGGPPCQAYSLIGRSRDPECMRNDHRNYLYHHYINFLNEFNPDFFVFENVPGILSAHKGLIFQDFKKCTAKLGYTLDYDILDSKYFDVLQSRKRLVAIGHKSEGNFKIPQLLNGHDYIVSDILNDLPELEPGEGSDSAQQYARGPSEYLINTGIRSGGKNDILIQHRARYHNENDRKIYRLAVKVWNNEERRIKYEELPEGLKTHKNTKSFVDRFKVVAGNRKTSNTVVAHISKDGHYYIHPDINQARSLTVREAARIQSFPDNYKFEGPITSQFRQIGNAVPPLMAKEIASRIKNLMEG